MELKFACADFAFPLLPHDDVLKLIAMLDMQGVDIGLFQDRSHLQPSGVFGNTKKHARELGKKLEDVNLKAADIFLQGALDFSVVAVNHPDPGVREKMRVMFEDTMEFAMECGCRHVSALPGVCFPDEPRETSLARCREELVWRCEQAEKNGLVFGVEAHVGSIASTPVEALLLVETTPGLTLTLDYTHFTRCGIPDSEVEPLIPHASHFHARGAANGELQTIFQRNEIDYAHIVSRMKDTDYKGYIGIEYTWNEWENCNRTDNISETILLRDFIRDAF